MMQVYPLYIPFYACCRMAQPFTVVSQGRLMIRIALEQNELYVRYQLIFALLLTALSSIGAVTQNSRLIWTRIPVSAEFVAGRQLNSKNHTTRCLLPMTQQPLRPSHLPVGP